MWDFISPVSLIRYLIVWRVNSIFVQLPRYLPTELSRVLGTLIAQRLPTEQAREWRKKVETWDAATASQGKPENKKAKEQMIPALPHDDGAWPIEAVLFAYPGKRALGQGEVILWELKLLGNSADHGMFLEVILPAMEEAGSTSDPRWQRPFNLWGRFDIQAVYAARGARWEPVASGGQLNLDYRATPAQWAKGLTFASERQFQQLTWIAPFDLDKTPDTPDKPSHTSRKHIRSSEVPTFQSILDALMERMTLFLPGKHRVAKDAWALLNPDDQTALFVALQQEGTRLQRHSLELPPRDWPGRWIGAQIFSIIPATLLPYLELASILHIGRQTHVGCGTFMLE